MQEIDWPPDIREKLERVNERLLSFRKYIEPARSKRVAHIDLHSQLVQRASLGGFPKNAEKQFLRDLQTFVDIAYGYVSKGDPLPITVAMSTDTDNLVRALEKSVIFDQCSRCNETERTIAVLDYEDRQ